MVLRLENPETSPTHPNSHDQSDDVEETFTEKLRNGKAIRLPLGSWDKFILRVASVIENEAGGTRIGLVDWKDGSKTQTELKVLDLFCPSKLMDFYEQHWCFHAGEELPSDTWDAHVEHVRMITEEETEGKKVKFAWLEMRNGGITKEMLATARKKCPRQLLQYYQAKT